MTQIKICEACLHENVVDTKFCVQCGQPLANNSTFVSFEKEVKVEPKVCEHVNNGSGKFCIKCGEPFSNYEEPAPVVPITQVNTDELAPVKKQKLPSTKNKKLVIILGVLLIVSAASWWILEKTLSNKADLIATLEHVVVSDDVDKFYDVLAVEDISDTEKKAYKQYLEENNIGEIANELVKSVNTLHGSDELVAQASTKDTETNQFNIVKSKKFGLFQSYTIKPVKYKVLVETYDNAVELNFGDENKKLSTEKPVNIGEYLPGNYTYSIAWKHEIGSVEEDLEFYVWPSEENVLEAKFDYYEVDLTGGYYDEWDYLANGKPIDTKLINDGRILVPKGVEFKLKATLEEDGVVYESEEVKITDSIYLTLSFPKYDEKLKNDYLKETTEIDIASLIHDYLNIYSNGDVARLSSVISTDSAFYKDQSKYLQSLVDQNIESVINHFEIVDTKENSENSYTVTVNESYMLSKPDAEPNVVNQKSIYTVKLIGSQYYITSLKLGK
ncbi:MAG: hypothetical protein RR651_11655 [Lysinibacillus sp.]